LKTFAYDTYSRMIPFKMPWRQSMTEHSSWHLEDDVSLQEIKTLFAFMYMNNL
jgi:hypothetical protein